MRSVPAFLVLGLVLSPVLVDAQKPGAESGGDAPVEVADALRLAFAFPRVVAANMDMSRAMVVEAVYQATALSGAAQMGRITNTGTLSPGYGGAFQYSPQPADRLVVHYGGQVHEFVVHEANGSSQAATSDDWILSPHQLRYSHRMGSEVEVEARVRFDGSAFEASMRGWAIQQGARYDLDLQSNGRTGGVRDYDGQDIQTAYDLVGTIRGGGLSLNVAERHTSSFVSATSLRSLPSQRGSASQASATLSSTLEFGGASYQFQNVQVESGSRSRGGQDSGGVTGVSGSVLRNGQSFGQFGLQGGRALLNTGAGLIAMDGLPVR